MNEISNNPAAATALIAVLWAGLTASVKVIVSGHSKRVDEKFAAQAAVQSVQGTKLDALKDGMAEMKLDAERARAELSERLSRTESKLPNGELTRVLGALAGAVERMPMPVVRSRRRVSAKT